MKKTICLAAPALLVSLILAAVIWGQSAPGDPVTLTIQGTEVVAMNASSKAIVLIGLRPWQAGQPVTDIGAHDMYFRPLQPGQTHQLVPPGVVVDPPVTRQQVVVVQFIDGTTWGDATLLTSQLSDMINIRPAMRKVYQGAVAAYNSGGDSALQTFFENTMANHQDAGGVAQKYLQIMKSSGAAAAISTIKTRLAAAPTSF
ncbi:MAG TPA: hypothetical protein VEI01_18630 [Terriglobales bacterium]|nr:hypothetical protein [Terriglobales bacterium]